MSNLNDYRAHMQAASEYEAEARELTARVDALVAEHEETKQELEQQEQALSRSSTAYLNGTSALDMDGPTAAIAALRVKLGKIVDLIGIARSRVHEVRRLADRSASYAGNVVGAAQTEKCEAVVADRLAGKNPDLDLVAALEKISTNTLLRLLDDAGTRDAYEAARTRVLSLN